MNQPKIVLLALSALLLLTGCADKGALGKTSAVGGDSELNSENEVSGAGLVPIAEIKETFGEETAKIKAGNFDNINFENAAFSFPEVGEVCALEYVKTKSALSPDEAYDYMCRRIEEFFPGMYSDEEKASEIVFTDRNVLKDGEEHLDRFPTFQEYKEMGLETEFPSASLSNDRVALEFVGGQLLNYANGDLEKREGYSAFDFRWELSGGVRVGRFDAMAAYPTVYRTDDLESGEMFHLASGDVSIAEAAEFTQNYLSGLEVSMREIPFTLALQSVYVLDVGDGCRAFYFTIVPEYKGMRYDSAVIDGSSYGISPVSNTTNEFRVAGNAVMYEKDKISRVHPNILTYYYDISEVSSHTSVISLEKAAELASKHLSGSMRFKAESVSAIYKEISEKEIYGYSDEEIRDSRPTVRPCWKFLLQPTTEPKKYFHVYVDMLTGDVYTFVQLMSSYEE